MFLSPLALPSGWRAGPLNLSVTMGDRDRPPAQSAAACPCGGRAAGAGRDGAGGAGALARARGVRAVAAPTRGRATVGVLRGTADGERSAGHPPRAVARVQGHLSPLQDDERL